VELSVDRRPAISRSVITRDDLIAKLMPGPLKARATAQVREGGRTQDERRGDAIDDEKLAEAHRRVYPDKRVYQWKGYRDGHRGDAVESISTTRSESHRDNVVRTQCRSNVNVITI